MAEPVYLRRFSRTERAIHWVHAAAFVALFGSGRFLYVPALAERIGRRALFKTVHLDCALAWAAALALIVLVGDRRGLRQTLRQIDRFDADDLRWLLGRRAPPGRFNAGQKLNAIATGAFALLFAISGVLLWYGERDTRFRLPGTLALHDGLMYASLALLAGHLYLALVHPSTRHAMRGITLGSVRADWALSHHAKWVAEALRQTPASSRGEHAVDERRRRSPRRRGPADPHSRPGA